MRDSRHSGQEKDVYGLFNDSFPPVLDGVTLTVENYCRWLNEAGHKVCVITPWCPDTPSQDTIEMHRYLSLPIYNRHPYRYGYPKLDPFIWRSIRRVPFRIVHAHCPFSSGKLAAYASRYHDVPLVTTFHSKYRTDLEHSLAPWLVRKEMRKIMRFYDSATEVWIPQAAVEETIREYGYRGKVRVVENGSDFADGIDDLDLYRSESRRAIGLREDQIGLLFVGQHILEKGIEVIVKALTRLDGIDYKMNFIGVGYARDQMISLVRELGLCDRVTFHGVIDDRETLRRFYAGSDLFLFPSFYDNAPLVVREAAAVRTPSVLLSGSTAAENIIDGSNGFLTQRTSEAYAEVIRRLASDREAIDRAGHGARATLCRPWSDVIDEVMRLYDEIIERYECEHK